MPINQQLVMQLAERSGLLHNTDSPILKGQGAFPWHRKQLYAFAELIIANQEAVLNSPQHPNLVA
jgi:hypothetical protein